MPDQEKCSPGALVARSQRRTLEAMQEIRERAERKQELLDYFIQMKKAFDIVAQGVGYTSGNNYYGAGVGKDGSRVILGLAVKKVDEFWREKNRLVVIKDPDYYEPNNLRARYVGTSGTEVIDPSKLNFDQLYFLIERCAPLLLDDMIQTARDTAYQSGDAILGAERVIRQIERLNPGLFAARTDPYSSEYDSLKLAQGLIAEWPEDIKAKYQAIIDRQRQTLDIMPALADMDQEAIASPLVDKKDVDALLSSVQITLKTNLAVWEDVDKVAFEAAMAQLEQQE